MPSLSCCWSSINFITTNLLGKKSTFKKAFHIYHNYDKSNNRNRHYTTLVDRMLIVKRNVIYVLFFSVHYRWLIN